MGKHEFDFEMTCEGCVNAAKEVLGKIDVTDVTADIPNKKLFVTTDKSSDEVLAELQKTGKTVSFVKTE